MSFYNFGTQGLSFFDSMYPEVAPEFNFTRANAVLNPHTPNYVEQRAASPVPPVSSGPEKPELSWGTIFGKLAEKRKPMSPVMAQQAEQPNPASMLKEMMGMGMAAPHAYQDRKDAQQPWQFTYSRPEYDYLKFLSGGYS